MAQMRIETYEKKKKHLQYLKTVRQDEVSEHLKEARAFGDISENAEYDAAQNEQAELQVEIENLEEELRNAEIIDYSSQDTDSVIVGSVVKLKNLVTDGEEEYLIVVTSESDVFSGKISNESPLGAALIGCKAGDSVEFELPNGNKASYEILEIKAE
jgi:transcription elongation factor GreA